MPISRSVGRTARNDLTDVLLVQILINMNSHRFPDPARQALRTDGRIGPGTIGAIEQFETVVMKQAESDGMLVPGDATIRALLDGLPAGPTREKLQVVMPRALPEKIDRCYEPLVKGMTKYEIDTPLRAAHFIAQIGHETASFLYMEEIADGSRYEARSDLGGPCRAVPPFDLSLSAAPPGAASRVWAFRMWAFRIWLPFVPEPP